MPPKSSSAHYARQALADRLRSMRQSAGLTARALATAAGWHESKTSRIEHARTSPSDADIRVWCRVCHVPDDVRNELLAELHAVDSLWLDWRRMERTGLRQAQESVRDLYERTTAFRFYSSQMIPGPIQTAPYVRALLETVRERRSIEVDDVDAAVAERMDRQHIVHEGNHRFAILLEEATLRIVLGGPDVMAGQLGHLLAVASLPSMSLGIIPQGRDRATWPVETFFMFDDEQVNVELVSGLLSITQPREVSMYAQLFGELSESAVFGSSARSIVTEAIEKLG